jgi:hypothetical protein
MIRWHKSEKVYPDNARNQNQSVLGFVHPFKDYFEADNLPNKRIEERGFLELDSSSNSYWHLH